MYHDTRNQGGECGRVCVWVYYTNLGSETIVITHFLCGPTVVHVFASSTIALASRRPYPYEWLTAETKRENRHEFQSDGSSIFTLPAPTLQLNTVSFHKAALLSTRRLRRVWNVQRAEEKQEGDAVPLRPTPLVLQSLVSRWAGWDVRTTRCCMSLHVRFLLEQG